VFTNKKREGINSFVYVVSFDQSRTINSQYPSFGIVSNSFVGQPFSKQLYTYEILPPYTTLKLLILDSD